MSSRFVLLFAGLSLFGCHSLLPLEPSPNPDADTQSVLDGASGVDLLDATTSESGSRDAPLPRDAGVVDTSPFDANASDQPGTDTSGPLAITSTPVIKVSFSLPYKYDAEVNTDLPVTWSLTDKPSGMTVDPASGLVTWPPPHPLGTYPVLLKVTDGAQEATQPYDVVVVFGGGMNGLRPLELSGLLVSGLPARLASGPLDRIAPRGPLDRGTRRALSYLTSCALAPGDRLQVLVGDGTLLLEGGLGLAPGWRRRPCDASCQEWISACVAARVNAWGKPVTLSLVGAHPALPDGIPRSGQEAEGAFFGNLFGEEPALFSCRARNAPPPASGRQCALPGGCPPITSVGICEDVCEDGPDGYASCRGHQQTFTRPITVIIKRSEPSAI